MANLLVSRAVREFLTVALAARQFCDGRDLGRSMYLKAGSCPRSQPKNATQSEASRPKQQMMAIDIGERRSDFDSGERPFAWLGYQMGQSREAGRQDD